MLQKTPHKTDGISSQAEKQKSPQIFTIYRETLDKLTIKRYDYVRHLEPDKTHLEPDKNFKEKSTVVPEKIKVICDFGNRSTLVRVDNMSTGEVLERVFHSLVAFPGYEVPHVAIAPASAYLDITGGPSETLWGGQTVVVGEGAYDFDSRLPVFKLDTSNGAGKISSALFFTLGMLDMDSTTSYEVVEMVVLHPDPSAEVLKAYQSALTGHHYVVRNGISLDVLIRPDSLVLMPEGLAGYYEAVGLGVMNPKEKNAYLDIGGLSAITAVVGSRGPLPGARINSPRGGVHSLGKAIGQQMKAAGMFPGGTFDTGLILDGLLNGMKSTKATKGTRYVYGSANADVPIHFDEFVAKARRNWAMQVASLYSEVAADWGSERARTLTLGGGSHYFAPAIAALNQTGFNFVSLDEPETANVKGAARLMDEAFLVQVGLPVKEVELSGRARQVPYFALV